MSSTQDQSSVYVIKSEELVALNYLPRNCPSPVSIEWIDRGTNRNLSPTRRGELIRTYHRPSPSPGIMKLREAAGIRVTFHSEHDRFSFASLLLAAKERAKADQDRYLTGIFASIGEAEKATRHLAEAGVAEERVAMMWHANRFMDSEFEAPVGHRRRKVLAGVSGGGLAAAAVGTAILLLPGVGPVTVTGAVLASTYSAMATTSGIIGATGAALATMLTDKDVEEVAVNHLEEQLRRGHIFVSVDHSACDIPKEEIVEALETSGGRIIEQ
ncbi:hypothetical protein [Aurantiacibacter sp. MUD61]|uniref:hypothetical protein n=1 Tax=Aurantiacibacter sp. MUD61 TaxID=3009083 RepID=UPI0022F0F163|nr:hypothetical protein [Aurantiacibacter sp. MUD61]